MSKATPRAPGSQFSHSHCGLLQPHDTPSLFGRSLVRLSSHRILLSSEQLPCSDVNLMAKCFYLKALPPVTKSVNKQGLPRNWKSGECLVFEFTFISSFKPFSNCAKWVKSPFCRLECGPGEGGGGGPGSLRCVRGRVPARSLILNTILFPPQNVTTLKNQTVSARWQVRC